MIRTWMLAPLGLTASLLPGCTDDPSDPPVSSSFVVKGVSGKDVLVDRRWDRGCNDAGGFWQRAERTLTGLELVSTWIDYENDSRDPDCTTGRVAIARAVQILTNDKVLVPFSWVDAAGNPSAAPAGLEGVTMSNGASARVTAAFFTTETQARTDRANAEAFCGITDWVVGVPREIVECFTQGVDVLKGTLVVDDRTTPWYIYDGVGDFIDYPRQVLSLAPHRGPL